MRVYMRCSGCGIHEWDGEIWQLTIEGDGVEPTELTFHSQQCLLHWLVTDDDDISDDDARQAVELIDRHEAKFDRQLRLP